MITISFLLVIFLIGCSKTDDNKGFTNVSAEKAHEMIKTKDLVLLDVRTLSEYKQAHIEGTVIIPVQTLQAGYDKIIDSKDKPVLIYCRSGNRSVTASNILLEKGFKDVYNMEGGIKAWIKAGFPIRVLK